MQFCYGDKNNIRILEEARFWKRQESEHTTVIKEIVSSLEEEFLNNLNKYYKIFSSTESVIIQYFEKLNKLCYNMTPEIINQIKNMIDITLQQSRSFVNFLNHILVESNAVKNNLVAGTVINHIIRESEYYIGIAKAYFSYENCQ